MRSILFFLPHQVGPLPVFGWGWALLFLVCFFILRAAARRMSGQTWKVALGDWLTWLIVGAVIAMVIPRIESVYPDGAGGNYSVGLRIPGYGLMLVLGVIAAVAMSYQQCRRIDWPLDRLLSLSTFTLVGGLVGARLFFVIQKWSELSGDTFFEKLYEALKFTEGGLVVYGSVLGAIVTVSLWCWLHNFRMLAVIDLVVPGFLLGLALGRIGCLMNGCCYGGICESQLPAITFPRGSPPYMDQLDSGRLLGLRVATAEKASGRAVITEVAPGSWAEAQGIRPGDTLDAIHHDIYPPPRGEDPAGPLHVMAQVEIGDRTFDATQALPSRSLPTHPSQIYAAINAALLSAFLFSLWPNISRDGVVFGVGWILYGISRWIEEWIRIDEGGQFGTSLSIAQWISLAGIASGTVILFLLNRMPPVRAWKPGTLGASPAFPPR